VEGKSDGRLALPSAAPVLFGAADETLRSIQSKHVMAVHTIWTPRSPLSREKVVQLYGFRKKAHGWQLTASEILGRL
jgi:hypothetical protein